MEPPIGPGTSSGCDSPSSAPGGADADPPRFHCTVCDGQSGEPLLALTSYPAYLTPVPPELASGVRRGPLQAWHCLHCGHLQQPAPDPSLQAAIYGEYYAHYRADSDESLVPIYRAPFESFVTAQAAALPRGLWLEIGCSSGERVDFLMRFADRYVGIDPSHRIEIARERHPEHRFIAGQFPDDAGTLAADVAVSQFNLEHIVACGPLLAALHRHVRPGGALVAQVPDVAEFARRGQPNFLAHEHIHYFRAPQLDLVLRRHGWTPFAWGPEGPSLIVAARRTTAEMPRLPEPGQRDWSHQRALFDATPRLPGGPITFYGVGPLLYWMLSNGRPSGSVTVVDDNPAYHAMALPAYGWPVQALDPELIEGATVVLSLNPAYHSAVLKRLAATGRRCRALGWAEGRWQEHHLGG
jgi:SAM-dependent methyltransferase